MLFSLFLFFAFVYVHKVCGESVIRCVQILDEKLGLSNERHKVGITNPTRDNMEMVVIGNAGSCTVSDIHACIKSVWFVMYS